MKQPRTGPPSATESLAAAGRRCAARNRDAAARPMRRVTCRNVWTGALCDFGADLPIPASWQPVAAPVALREPRSTSDATAAPIAPRAATGRVVGSG